MKLRQSQYNPNLLQMKSFSEDVVATVKPGAAGGEPAFLGSLWDFCR